MKDNLVDLVRIEEEQSGKASVKSPVLVPPSGATLTEDGRDSKIFPSGVAFPHPVKYAGVSAREKVAKVTEAMRKVDRLPL